MSTDDRLNLRNPELDCAHREASYPASGALDADDVYVPPSRGALVRHRWCDSSFVVDLRFRDETSFSTRCNEQEWANLAARLESPTPRANQPVDE
jgi:hypothetical protein